ncbi:MAG TPA: hypothetical protein DEW33_11650 [Lachnospiraceae bacterium]|nr:hypothetical protein [Lachnospiraceae bacterium]
MMLKILIIDDDILTRKGIQTLMPWKEHQMTIVGEASNGKEALAFLESHPDIDLALVDLDMPIMGGAAFIEAASERYPNLSYVVLTVHTEFEYVQQILRLGAIDYISKTQFDQENFDQILNRIQAGISKKTSLSKSLSDWRLRQILTNEIYALISIDQDKSTGLHQFFEENQIAPSDRYEYQENIWIFQSDHTRFLFPDPFHDTMLLSISGVYEMTYSSLGKSLNQYLKNQFFYDYRPLQEINHINAFELCENTLISDDATFEFMKQEWTSLNWIHENELFDRFRVNLKNCHLKPSQLYHFLLNLEMLWNSSYREVTGESIPLPASFANWFEVEEWLTELYERAQFFRTDLKYSNDVTKQIFNAKVYIDQNYASTLDATEIARNAGMSYSYFSRCFHDIIGQSFSDYCTTIRLEHAKDLLSKTNKSIQAIAISIGYQDEKYFSRLFKKSTGKSPSEFRKCY